MREIKFRSWDKRKKIMFNVHELKVDQISGEFSWIRGYGDADKDGTDVYGGGVMIYAKETRYDLMQHTGLKDKNGTGIYEGDIVLVKYIDNGCMCEEKIQVISENEKGYSPFNWEQICDGCDCSLEIKSVEVIGNIYENEKLLK